MKITCTKIETEEKPFEPYILGIEVNTLEMHEAILRLSTYNVTVPRGVGGPSDTSVNKCLTELLNSIRYQIKFV